MIDFIPNRYVTMISGGNGAGKTSALDVVFYALAGRKTLSPTLIRQGQKKGFIRVETTTHIVTRHLDDKGGRLQIEAKASNTLEKSPDDWLNGIAGGLGLDPLKFMRMDADEQMENIRPLVKLDVDIDDLETRNEADTETLKARKAEAKRLEAARDHVTVDKTLPAESADIPELLQQSRAAAEHNEAIKAEKRRRDSIEDQSIRFNQQYEAKQKEIANLQSELALLKNSIDATLKTRKEWKPLAELQDLAPLDAKVSEATRTNSAIATNNANKATRDRFERDVDTIKTQVEKLEEDVRTRRIRIATALEKAKFPIAGTWIRDHGRGIRWTRTQEAEAHSNLQRRPPGPSQLRRTDQSLNRYRHGWRPRVEVSANPRWKSVRR